MQELILSFLAAATLIYAAPQDSKTIHSERDTAASLDWSAAYSKASTALGKLSSGDKVNIVTGIGWNKGPCVGNAGAVSSIGYPSLCLQDGPLGVRYAGSVTAFPPGVQAASTWDRSLMQQRGAALGNEAKQLGVHVQLGPVAGPLGKIPNGGRNWEGFAADPYLTGIAMAETIDGMQSAGVQATAKHYVLNEQELNREKINSAADDRTMHELYLWPFADAVKANVASVMCSYNKINGAYACENDKAINVWLKQEMGFQGYVMTDWNAQHTTDVSAKSGLDMTMPGSDYEGKTILWGPQLSSAISSGKVSQSRVDDAAKRILAAWYLLGQDSGYPSVKFDGRKNGNPGPNVQGDHKNVARAVARDGIVLLKNTGNVLPLKKPASLAIIGYDAAPNPGGINSCVDRGCDNGTLAMGWGSGTANFPYLIAPVDAIKAQAQKDGTKVSTSTSDDASQGASAAQSADIALVFISANSGEGYIKVEGVNGDRPNLDPWHNGNNLVAAVAKVNKKVIVVAHSVGPIILENILSSPNVVGIVWAGLPGQESGNALVDVLYGSTNPSGKLPYTIGKKEGDYGTSVKTGDDTFSEGLFIDYRHFDKNSIEPRYEFGFGLSYTTFAYSAIAVQSTATAGAATGAITSGGPKDLFDIVATVTATVTNNGTVAGAEVAQLYIGLPASAPASPPKQLRGFEKLSLDPGASGKVTFELRKKDLSYWDTTKSQWVVPSGQFTVSVGASSRDIRLTDKITV